MGRLRPRARLWALPELCPPVALHPPAALCPSEALRWPEWSGLASAVRWRQRPPALARSLPSRSAQRLRARTDGQARVRSAVRRVRVPVRTVPVARARGTAWACGGPRRAAHEDVPVQSPQRSRPNSSCPCRTPRLTTAASWLLIRLADPSILVTRGLPAHPSCGIGAMWPERHPAWGGVFRPGPLSPSWPLRARPRLRVSGPAPSGVLDPSASHYSL